MTTVYVDVETDSLRDDAEVVEIAYWADGFDPICLVPPHMLTHSDYDALRINRYYERRLDDRYRWCSHHELRALRSMLEGAEVAGSSPWFDAGHLKRMFGMEVWDHRLINVPEYYAGTVGLPRSLGLGGSVEHAKEHFGVFFERGPNHTAMGDVHATRTLHKWALNYNQIRSNLP